MSVVVVTDSAAGLPADLVERHAIRVVPLHVLVDGVTYREGIDALPFGAAVRNVTTSGASPAALRSAYERARELSGGDGVVAVHISRRLSGTWDVARHAIEEMDGADGRVRLVDSFAAGLGTGFAVLCAARRAQAGAGLDEVYRVAVGVAARSNCYIVVDRPEQLRRGGRIGTAAIVFGTALVARPLLHLADGRIVLVDKARTVSRAIDKLVDAAVHAAGTGPVVLGVQHLEAEIAAQRVVDGLRSRVPQPVEFVVGEFGPSLGAHLGVGSVGVVVSPAAVGPLPTV